MPNHIATKAIILAAGRGRRLKGLTDHQPKCLVELNGKTLLDRQLEALRDAGITDIAIVTGYKRELLADRGLVEFHNSRWSTTNMVSSLASAQEWLQEQPCIVSYSDIFYSPAAAHSLMNCVASLAVTYDPNWLELWSQRFEDPLLDAETFRLTPEHNLAEIGNKPTSIEDVQGQYMGLLRFTPEGWAELARIRSCMSLENRDSLHMTGALQRIIDMSNLAIAALPYSDCWGEVDFQADLSIYQDEAFWAK
jgi:L-glutamine-phosphate cytidylyltransferase